MQVKFTHTCSAVDSEPIVLPKLREYTILVNHPSIPRPGIGLFSGHVGLTLGELLTAVDLAYVGFFHPDKTVFTGINIDLKFWKVYVDVSGVPEPRQ